MRRLARVIALAALFAALIPLLLWAVPPLRPKMVVHLTWADDGGDQITQWLVRRGLDRHGYVHQEQVLVWNAPTPAGLAEVRQKHAENPRLLVQLPPTESWKLQYMEYGNNHVYLPHGLMTVDGGVLQTLPYSLMAAVLAAPAGLWALRVGWRRLRRIRTGVVASAATAGR